MCFPAVSIPLVVREISSTDINEVGPEYIPLPLKDITLGQLERNMGSGFQANFRKLSCSKYTVYLITKLQSRIAKLLAIFWSRRTPLLHGHCVLGHKETWRFTLYQG